MQSNHFLSPRLRLTDHVFCLHFRRSHFSIPELMATKRAATDIAKDKQMAVVLFTCRHGPETYLASANMTIKTRTGRPTTKDARMQTMRSTRRLSIFKMRTRADTCSHVIRNSSRASGPNGSLFCRCYLIQNVLSPSHSDKLNLIINVVI